MVKLLLPSAVLFVALPWGCASSGPVGPKWTVASVDYGQGQLRLGIRPRSMAKLDDMGATIRTPEGGEALVRVFMCGNKREQVVSTIRSRLRGHLVREQIFDHGQAFALRWTAGNAVQGLKHNTAVAMHGPLLISATSTNLPLEEVVQLAMRVGLDLPVPLIDSCFPICGADEQPCVPRAPTESQ